MQQATSSALRIHGPTRFSSLMPSRLPALDLSDLGQDEAAEDETRGLLDDHGEDEDDLGPAPIPRRRSSQDRRRRGRSSVAVSVLNSG